jgi:hypothetical protein
MPARDSLVIVDDKTADAYALSGLPGRGVVPTEMLAVSVRSTRLGASALRSKTPAQRPTMRERCVSGWCGTSDHGVDSAGCTTLPDQVVPDLEVASGTTRQALARTFNPLVVGSSPTGSTGGGRRLWPLTCCAASDSTSVGSGAASFSGACVPERAACRPDITTVRTASGRAAPALHPSGSGRLRRRLSVGEVRTSRSGCPSRAAVPGSGCMRGGRPEPS